jgi:hypothetical protein
MPVLSIVACKMLEDELVHVLSKDKAIDQLLVVENRDNFDFLRKLKLKDCIPTRVYFDNLSFFVKKRNFPNSGGEKNFFLSLPFLSKIAKNRRNKEKNKVTIIVNLLSLGLHVDLETLKTEVYETIREIAPFSDALLIFYGSCGHSLGKLEVDFTDLKCPLYFLKDKNGEIVEDCISLALGGNEAYARAMTEFIGKGTMYLTPMWASNWKKFKKQNEDFNNSYLKNPFYCLVAKIDTGLENTSEFQRNVKEFACTYNMQIVNLKGNVEITEQAYFAARENMKPGKNRRSD